MRWTIASRALRLARVLVTSGLAAAKSDAIRDHLAKAGFSDIAVFAGTAPALDAESEGASPPDTARGVSILAGLKKVVLRSGMEALYFSGAHRLLRPLLGGVGAILTLHHVRPPRADAFQPNRLLEVSPAFLEDVIRGLRRDGRRYRHA